MRSTLFLTLASAVAQTASATFAITGVEDGTTGIRREIREFQTGQPDMFNLYILALAAFQQTDYTSLTSYYQITGIHGLPDQVWDGVTSNPTAVSQGGSGFCTHSSPIFPLWHRPYVALFEQALYAEVTRIANTFTGSDLSRYQNAAKGLRQPYWDWAWVPSNGAPALPPAFTTKTINVNSPSGPKTIANPLFNYRIQQLNDHTVGGTPWTNWAVTLRYPTSTATDATSNEQSAINALTNNLSSARQNLYAMFFKCTNWLEFADDSAQSSTSGCSSSLESIHDNIHVLTGGGGAGGDGDMTDLSQAARDAIFFNHHAMVDRAFALWQVVNPNTYFTTGNSGPPTWATPENYPLNGQSHLLPFHRDTSGTPWLPGDVRNVETFHYTYLDLGTKSEVVANINRLYGSSAPQTQARPAVKQANVAKPASSLSSASSSSVQSSSAVATSPPATTVTQGGMNGAIKSMGTLIASNINSLAGGPLAGNHFVANAASSAANGIESAANSVAARAAGVAAPSGVYPSGVARPSSPSFPIHHSNSTSNSTNYDKLCTPQGRTHDYSCNIVAERMGLGGSYTVFVFFGDVPAASSEWPFATNLVGSQSVFSSSDMRKRSGFLVAGSVALTCALVGELAAGSFASLDESVVTPWLKDNMNWVVMTSKGQVVPNENVPGLAVSVASQRVMPVPPGQMNTMPTYGQAVLHNEVTHGKAGGLSKGMPHDFWSVCKPNF